MKIFTQLDNLPNLYWYKFPIMGNLTGPGMSLKGFIFLEPAILIFFEKDDRDLAALNIAQLLKYLEYIIAMFCYVKPGKEKNSAQLHQCRVACNVC